MTVYLPKDGRTWRYSFQYKKQRYVGSTGQLTKQEAETFELEEMRRVRRRVAGLDPPPAPSVRIHAWAEVYLDRVITDPRMGITRPDRVKDNLRVVLRFWGHRPDGKTPKTTPIEGEPYHDLLLTDPIQDADWLVKFDEWMTRRGRSGQTKNQYRSTMSQMYTLALQPEWRKKTGVTVNPFLGIYRDQTGERDVTIAPEALRQVLAHASYHVRLAIAIGALAPKLRHGNILALRWSQHLDRDLRFITVHAHKTRKHTNRPLVIPIADQLRRILEDARRRSCSDAVVAYRGRPVKTIRGGVRAAVKAAGLPYGRAHNDGITFHALRHTAATLLAELDVAEGKRKAVLGHTRLETTQRYTHLRPMHEVAPLALLSETLPIADVVTQPWTRASRKRKASA